MELLFETRSAEYLREVICDTVSQEETADTIVPDSEPDVGRILETYGTVILRGKECRAGVVSITGAVQAGVLYGPEDQSAPRALQVYIPFTIQLENDAVTENTRVCAELRLRNMDARILNSRKIMVRTGLCGRVTGYEPVVQELYGCTPPAGADLQVKCGSYPVVRAVETAEKSFQMSEEAEFPSGRSPMRELYKYQLDVDVTDARMAGNKGIFKGNVDLRLLYLTEEEELAVWSCQLPFSQYVELEREYEEEELQVQLALADAGIEDANGQGKRLLVDLQLLAQCTVIGQENMEIIEDAYSLHHDFTPDWRTVDAAGRLDRQLMTQVVRGTVRAPVKEIIDVQAYLDTPTIRRDGQQVQITAPVCAGVIYIDENGETMGAAVRMEGECQTELAEGCLCRASARLAGEAFAVPSGDGLEVRCTVAFTVDSHSGQGLRALAGGQLSDELRPQGDRPSVILRRTGPEESLWSIAKDCGTTVAAISAANGLTEDSVTRTSGMLLIPILKT